MTTYLTRIVIFTALMWVLYGLNRAVVNGLVDAVGYPNNPKPLSAWATRMKAAHYNAVENLVIFGTLVLVAYAAGVSNATTVLAFTMGFVCQLALVWKILA